MDDDTFLRRFEDLTLPESDFDHRAHVRLAYLYLTRHGFAEALARLSAGIRAFATANGAPAKYHETVTVAFVSIINERLNEQGAGGGWQAFLERNTELLDRRLLSHYYAPETLRSEVARRAFVLPGFSEKPIAG